MSAHIRPAVALAGVGLAIGLFAITRKAKAASAQSSRELPSDAPSSPAAPGEPPLLPARTSSAEEGQPLPWDQREHPLAERGLDDAGDLDVIDVTAEVTEPVPVGPASMPTSSPAPPPPPAPTAKPKSKAKRKPAPAPAPAAPTSSPAAPPAPSSTRDPAQAARDLYAHADRLLKANRGSELGTARAPSSVVLAAQTDMGGVKPDGIYGPDTRARGRALIGKTFPVRK